MNRERIRVVLTVWNEKGREGVPASVSIARSKAAIGSVQRSELDVDMNCTIKRAVIHWVSIRHV